MTDSDATVLQSTSNPTIRRLVRMRDNRARRRAKRILVDGWRETSRAMEAGFELAGLYLQATRDNDPNALDGIARKLVEIAKKNGSYQPVSASLMSKISFGQSSRGVVAEFVEPEQEISQIELPPAPIILVLDKIEKPGNLGAIFRSSDAAGVDAIFLCDCVDTFNPNAIRNSQGSVFHIPSATGSQEEIAKILVSHQIRTLAARVESSQSLWESNLKGSVAVILGNEADGLGDRWERLQNETIPGIQIPMMGKADSLNVSVTAAVIAMEMRRQRLTSTQ